MKKSALTIWSVFWSSVVVLTSSCAAISQSRMPSSMPGVAFPGPAPGIAHVAQKNGLFTLENNVIAMTWAVENGALKPTGITNKTSGAHWSQNGAELFRLATRPDAPRSEAVFVGVRLDAAKVSVQTSGDGVAWTEVASFPRTDYSGEPHLIRLGKMNLRAQSKDNPDLGAVGECLISEVNPTVGTWPDGKFLIRARAHQALTREMAFPAGTKFVSCRIDKGTDQGLSWGPALALVWDEGQKFILVGVREKKPVLNITTAAGEIIKGVNAAPYPVFDLGASSFRLMGKPKLLRLAPQANGVRLAERIRGMAIEADFVAPQGIRAQWRAELRDGSNYIRQTVNFAAPEKTISLYGVELADLRVPDAHNTGTVPGCPVAGSGMFFGVEMPGAQNALNNPNVRIGFGCQLQISPTQNYTFGSVAGVAPAGQLRRSFLYYIERERARPSKPFLHYNCWYDLGFGTSEDKMLDVVRRFDEEMVKKRGVPVLSYLVDDGWDDVGKGLWAEDSRKFPQGFSGLNARMAKMNAHLSVWISPLGGYGGAKERTGLARQMGLIPAGGELDLAQPAYKKWFQERCLSLMRESGVNAFKWDRAGEGVSPHFMALLDVARALRVQNPYVFINVTVGTWPSPFWLNHVDTTWRNGSADVGWAGKGDDREKWLTFRDGYCHRMFVEASPLYPLNSAMHHGIVHGRAFQGEKVGKSGNDLKNEARSYFANGASLQELYLTPSMMTPAAWDSVAEAAKWAQANSDVLLDAHWVGGDALKLQPYGYAAWNARKGTLMLRNPDDKAQNITLEAAALFELPTGAPRTYVLRSPYKDQRLQKLTLKAGTPQNITLEPFEVLVFDALPQ